VLVPIGPRPAPFARSYADDVALAIVLAHQGGWDEILLVAAPMVVVAALLWLAKRRVTRSGPP
jgi:hypothetical protein